MSLHARRFAAATSVTALAAALMVTTLNAPVAVPGASTAASASGLRPSIVIAAPGQVAAAAAAVRASGGSVGKPLAIVNGFTAKVSTAAAAALNSSAAIVSVTDDATLQAASESYDPAAGATSSANLQTLTDSTAGGTGSGVTVAVLDTGITPVPDLAGRVIAGVDLSGEGDALHDSYGHGTVMAGLIAGNGSASDGRYTGIAPAARVVSVKVAGRSGATDVSQILAGLQWIGSYAAQDNIRVVSLAWGNPSHQPTRVDPLDFAVERLWSMGVTVVVAAGNQGPGAGTITKPGDDPVVITVGAYNDAGTATRYDDSSLDFSSRGPTFEGVSKPDLVAPGRTLVAVSSPGSVVEQDNPDALIDGGYIRGSGTSQATAVTAGNIALLLAARPHLTPDRVKYLLTTSARPLYGVARAVQGGGELNLARALRTSSAGAPVQTLGATGIGGTLEASRGGHHVSVICPGATEATEVVGEIDVRCGAFSADQWTADQWTADQWTADQWTADQWTADQWTADQWTADQWTADQWTADQWTADQWTASSWDAAPAAGCHPTSWHALSVERACSH